MIIALILLLILSIGLNGFAIWYFIQLLRDRLAIIELFKEFSPIIKNYEDHLTSMTKMELYYGDPTLMQLIDHTKEVSQNILNLLESVEIEENNKEE